MSTDQPLKPPELQGKESVEQAIVAIYDVAYAREIDLTPIDQAVDLIREALDIRLVDCDKCGETILIEHAKPIHEQAAGDESYRCRSCAQEYP